MLNNIKTKQSGFTIVELLIVIVVIAILAAISIVAYNGIQNRGKTSSAASLASQIQKKAEAWNTIQSSYPTYAQLRTNNTDAKGTGVGTDCATVNCAGTTANAGPAEAKLDDPSKITQSVNTDPGTVTYTRCSTSTAQVLWYHSSATKQIAIGLGGQPSTAQDGTGTTASACAAN